MGKENKKRLILATAIVLTMALLPVHNASGQTDSLVRLMNAKSIEQAEQNGQFCRKAIGATFLHNGTYLSCDTSFWNVDQKIINCFGHVQLVQGESLLTSEKLDYYINQNLAEFRGPVVQMINKQDNILRTRYLDYNTRDSIALFHRGASMKSREGQVIESDEGSYCTSRNLFKFRGNVNMYTDSVFVKTDSLDYDSKADKATFNTNIDFWKDDNMLSAGAGWYDRGKDLFFFRKDVHGLTNTQESWSDTLFFYRVPNNVLMRGNVQIQDSSRSVAAMSEYLMYRDSLSKVTLKGDASVAMWTRQDEKLDTIYCGAEMLVFQTIKKYGIPSLEIAAAESRLKDIKGDAVQEYRKRAADEARKAADEAKRGNANFASQGAKRGSSAPLVDSGVKNAPTDSLPTDDVMAATDTLAVQPSQDTTGVGFVFATGKVKIYRSDMQAVCDSLVFNELDSIARFYKEPLVWNEIKRQYSADSLFVLIAKGGPDRASLMSNAFIAVQEDSTLFDQIKSAEVMAYFDSTSALRRFDALGGADALFFLRENDTISTVNKVQCQMLSATLKDGQLEQAFYFQSPKNDAYPLVQLPSEDMRMKGFDWKPGLRPKSKLDVTSMEIKPSVRESYMARPKAVFRQTDIYFPGYMAGVYKGIEESKARKVSHKLAADSLAVMADSLSVSPIDSLSHVVADSLSIKAQQDSSAVVVEEEPYMSERELRRAMRIARRDARWADLDARDAAKAEAKKARAEARRQRRADRLAARQAKQDAKDEAKLQKYIEYFQKQKERNERREKQQNESAGERP